jgi:hypothetical protein
MIDPTMIKKGIASKGNEEADDINRCMTKLTGSESFRKRKYTIEEAISEKAMGTFKRNRINRRMMGI